MTSDMSKSIRSFIAVKLPETVLAAIGGVQERMAACGLNVRWVTTGNIHLTLKFLGEVDEEEVDDVATALQDRSGQVMHNARPIASDGRNYCQLLHL